MVVAIYSGEDAADRNNRNDKLMIVERPRVSDQDRTENGLIIVDRLVSRKNIDAENAEIVNECACRRFDADHWLIVEHGRSIGHKPDTENALLI